MRRRSVKLEQISDFVNLGELISPSNLPPRAARTNSESTREYDLEKWGKLIEGAARVNASSVSHLDQLFLGGASGVYSEGELLFWDSCISAAERYRRLVRKRLKRIHKDESVVELGAGYGAVILSYLFSVSRNVRDKTHFAFEFAPNGRKCIELASAKLDIITETCDFLSGIPFGEIPRGSIIFTSNALVVVEEMPSSLINKLIDSGAKSIVFFEPIVQFYGNGLLGQLQRAYYKKNRYNEQIWPQLRKFEDEGKISIASVERNFFGENFLLPTSAVVWHPR